MTRCPACGQTATPCPNRWCRQADRGFSVVFAAGSHGAGLRAAIVRYKYGGERRLASPLAGMLSRYVEARAAWFEEFDAVTAVPCFAGRGARREWDPAGLLLAELGGLSPWLQVCQGLLVKRRETPPMAGRPWNERQAIARGPLRSSLAVPDPRAVAGWQILVVDDVMTEGSTL